MVTSPDDKPSNNNSNNEEKIKSDPPKSNLKAEANKLFQAYLKSHPDAKNGLRKEDFKEARQVIKAYMKETYGVSIAPPTWLLKRAARMMDIPIADQKNPSSRADQKPEPNTKPEELSNQNWAEHGVSADIEIGLGETFNALEGESSTDQDPVNAGAGLDETRIFDATAHNGLSDPNISMRPIPPREGPKSPSNKEEPEPRKPGFN